ncbi:IS3 family transposase [Escherichia coli]|nr:transposase [Escherichia coli]EFH5780805.1 IS3 family transposase [Escherichia coli]EIE5155673.1 transposase [Escherichia coli]MBF8888519.1 IS3 family transposase [Escherichia coli]TDH35426.1 transposase [Escherichia coli]
MSHDTYDADRYLYYQCYGYRRLHAMLRHEGVRLSEKVVRRLIVE